MVTTTPAVSLSTLGAWLLKVSPQTTSVGELRRQGFREVTRRCVQPSYRTALVRAGQPVLLWVSGRDPRHPAGVHAVGHTTGSVQVAGAEVSMPVRLRAVEPVLTRDEILADPVLACLEVIRVPAGSNPSYLDTGQYLALRSTFPQLAASTGPAPSTAPPP